MVIELFSPAGIHAKRNARCRRARDDTERGNESGRHGGRHGGHIGR